jgi:glycosyltransferase involved in cell wall biosynthesis
VIRRLVHAITPGDHFSPLTGSAIPTVVDGISRHGRREPRPAVLVADGTYAERYGSADVIEYASARARRSDRYVDVLCGRAGLPRPGARRVFRAVLREQDRWPSAYLVAHNAPALVPYVDVGRHVPLLYAHNQVLGRYSARDAARVLAPAAAIVCVSDFLATQIRERLPASLHEKVRTVRNGVDTAMFGVPREPRQDHLRVVFVGRVIPAKGVHVLLDAVREIGRRDVEVTIIGRPGFDGSAPLDAYERRLRRTAASLPGPVRFASFVPRTELPLLLASADVSVVPSIWPEPFSLTALESMAAGAVVVASDVGGIPEALNDGGTLVPADDAGALAEVLEGLANEPSLDDASARSREAAAGRSWARAAAELSQVLHDQETR